MTYPQRILYLMDYFIGPFGGTERQLFELISHLDRKTFSPHFAVFRSTPYIQKSNMPCNATVLNINPNIFRPNTIMQLFRFSFFVRKFGFRIVHIYFNDAAMFAPFFCYLGGARVISSRRDMGFWYTPKKIAMLRFSNLFVDRIIANCHAVKHAVHNREHFNYNNINVIFNGLDENRVKIPPMENFRKKYNISLDTMIVGIVANISPIKRHRDLILAMSIVLKYLPNTILVIVGGGGIEEVANLKYFTQSTGIFDRVRFIGNVDNPIALIQHFDIAISCSSTEGLSNAIIEYIACAKPVICTITGGNVELIRNGDNGYLIPVGDIGALSDRIFTLLADPLLRKRMGNSSFNRSLPSMFSIPKMIEAHSVLYKNLL